MSKEMLILDDIADQNDLHCNEGTRARQGRKRGKYPIMKQSKLQLLLSRAKGRKPKKVSLYEIS